MQSEPLVIASTADEKFATGLGVMMCSALLCTRCARVRFHVIDGGILPETKADLWEKLERLAASRGMEVELHYLDFERIKLPEVSDYFGSKLAYARVYLPELLPEKSLFYVDADMICNKPFPDPEVADAHYGDRLLMACHDSVIRIMRADCPWVDGMSAEQLDAPYHNTGFVWMNLAGLREFGLQEKFHALAEVGKVMRFADQTALNFLLRGRIGTLDPDYNRLLSLFSDLDDIGAGSNLHFVGPEKPWIDPQGKGLYLHFPIYGIAASYFGFTGLALAKVASARVPLSIHYYVHIRWWWFRLKSSKRLKKCDAFKRRYKLMRSLRQEYRSKFQSLPPSPLSPSAAGVSAIPGGVP